MNSSSTTEGKNVWFCQLPEYPLTPKYHPNVSKPPAPILKVGKNKNIKTEGIMLTWRFASKKPENIVGYQLFIYQERRGRNTSNHVWRKVGDIKAQRLPMACFLLPFVVNETYHFIIRAVDNQKRLGDFSIPARIELRTLGPSLKTPAGTIFKAEEPHTFRTRSGNTGFENEVPIKQGKCEDIVVKQEVFDDIFEISDESIEQNICVMNEVINIYDKKESGIQVNVKNESNQNLCPKSHEESSSQSARPLLKVASPESTNELLIIDLNSSSTTEGENVMFCQLPKYPLTPKYHPNVSKPPAPILKVGKNKNIKKEGIMLTWRFASKKPENIVGYQLFVYPERRGRNTSNHVWMKVGDMKALRLPMACFLLPFVVNETYHFIIRAVDNQKRLGDFSMPAGIELHTLGPSLKTSAGTRFKPEEPRTAGKCSDNKGFENEVPIKEKQCEDVVVKQVVFDDIFEISDESIEQNICVMNEVINIYDKKESGIQDNVKNESNQNSCPKSHEESSSQSARPLLKVASPESTNELLIIDLNSSSTTEGENVMFCHLPKYPLTPKYHPNVSKPPAPILKVGKNKNIKTEGIMLTWRFAIKKPENIVGYQLFVYQEGRGRNTSNHVWTKVRDIKAQRLPMACFLLPFVVNETYHFIIRAVDNQKRLGDFSIPARFELRTLGPSLKTPAGTIFKAEEPHTFRIRSGNTGFENEVPIQQEKCEDVVVKQEVFDDIFEISDESIEQNICVMNEVINIYDKKESGIQVNVKNESNQNSCPKSHEESSSQSARPLLKVASPESTNELLIIDLNSSSTTEGENVMFCQLPTYPLTPKYHPNVSKPPAPILKVGKNKNIKTEGIMLTWRFASKNPENIVGYQLFVYQEGRGRNTSNHVWTKVGDMKALRLPMACFLSPFVVNETYHFIIRAVDSQKRLGDFSMPAGIELHTLGPSLKTSAGTIFKPEEPRTAGKCSDNKGFENEVTIKEEQCEDVVIKQEVFDD